ncbi:hypothetical protein DPEC_G00005390 [Dallia pectoralis]|uniref:Uncharacterized protein n=1 Tax=Dallia pectoralis TaxID=75939 RepID=A0ACC2HK73_DALPE|nr:hypothetical protein DPEC_G00005390 [Dallia pectoralis]
MDPTCLAQAVFDLPFGPNTLRLILAPSFLALDPNHSLCLALDLVLCYLTVDHPDHSCPPQALSHQPFGLVPYSSYLILDLSYHFLCLGLDLLLCVSALNLPCLTLAYPCLVFSFHPLFLPLDLVL